MLGGVIFPYLDHVIGGRLGALGAVRRALSHSAGAKEAATECRFDYRFDPLGMDLLGANIGDPHADRQNGTGRCARRLSPVSTKPSRIEYPAIASGAKPSPGGARSRSANELRRRARIMLLL
jgi:hypothetical protein